MPDEIIPLIVECAYCGTIFPSGFGMPATGMGGIMQNCGTVCPACRQTTELNGYTEGGKFHEVAGAVIEALTQTADAWSNIGSMLVELQRVHKQEELEALLQSKQWQWLRDLIEKLSSRAAADPWIIVNTVLNVLMLLAAMAAWRFPVAAPSPPAPPTVKDVIDQRKRQIKEPPPPVIEDWFVVDAMNMRTRCQTIQRVQAANIDAAKLAALSSDPDLIVIGVRPELSFNQQSRPKAKNDRRNPPPQASVQ